MNQSINITINEILLAIFFHFIKRIEIKTIKNSDIKMNLFFTLLIFCCSLRSFLTIRILKRFRHLLLHRLAERAIDGEFDADPFLILSLQLACLICLFCWPISKLDNSSNPRCLPHNEVFPLQLQISKNQMYQEHK